MNLPNGQVAIVARGSRSVPEEFTDLYFADVARQLASFDRRPPVDAEVARAVRVAVARCQQQATGHVA